MSPLLFLYCVAHITQPLLKSNTVGQVPARDNAACKAMQPITQTLMKSKAVGQVPAVCMQSCAVGHVHAALGCLGKGQTAV